jgi:hypothetical protein
LNDLVQYSVASNVLQCTTYIAVLNHILHVPVNVYCVFSRIETWWSLTTTILYTDRFC